MPYRITDVRTQRNGFRVYRMQDTSNKSSRRLDAVLSIAPDNSQSFPLEAELTLVRVLSEEPGESDPLERLRAELAHPRPRRMRVDVL
jgi:hypothetical protein